MTISPKLRSQGARFARIFAAAFVAQYAVISGHVDRTAVVAAVVAAAEVAFRQVFPA